MNTKPIWKHIVTISLLMPQWNKLNLSQVGFCIHVSSYNYRLTATFPSLFKIADTKLIYKYRHFIQYVNPLCIDRCTAPKFEMVIQVWPVFDLHERCYCRIGLLITTNLCLRIIRSCSSNCFCVAAMWKLRHWKTTTYLRTQRDKGFEG